MTGVCVSDSLNLYCGVEIKMIIARAESSWYSGALLAANAEHYRWGVFLMQAIDITTLLCLFSFYALHWLGDASIITDWNRKKSGNSTGQIIRQRKAAMNDTDSHASVTNDSEAGTARSACTAK